MFSGHSGRVGLYTAPSETGIAIEAVTALGRHKSLNVAQKYARKAVQLKGAPPKNPAGGNGAKEGHAVSATDASGRRRRRTCSSPSRAISHAIELTPLHLRPSSTMTRPDYQMISHWALW